MNRKPILDALNARKTQIAERFGVEQLALFGSAAPAGRWPHFGPNARQDICVI